MPGVFEKIMAFNQQRVPAMVTLKYRLISEDPFRFFRGTCHLFYEYLHKHQNWKDATRAWICGDLHLENFGSYKGDNRVVYFDMNDFDEALLAPVSWEVSRLLTSIYIAGQQLLFDETTADVLCAHFLDTYIHVLHTGKPLVVEKETATGLLNFFLQKVQLRREKDFVKSRMVVKKGQPQLLIDQTKALALPDAVKAKLIMQVNVWFAKQEHLAYTVIDAAWRVAGTGSVGVRRYVLLVQSNRSGRFRLLDLKESGPSSVLPFVRVQQPAWKNEALRIITLQKRVQHVSPALLHTVKLGNTFFVLKELQPTSDRMDLALCKGKLNKLRNILGIMAQITASGQLRATGRGGSSTADELMAFAAASKSWKAPVLRYAKNYAQQVLADYNEYNAAYKKSTGA